MALPDAVDTLEAGPRERPVWVRLLALAVIAGLVIGALGYGGWLLLRPPPLFSKDAVIDVYEGMVRNDGSNDLSTIGPGSPSMTLEADWSEQDAIQPPECTAIFAGTMMNVFPAAGLDGASTYWLGTATTPTISLFTVRYPTTKAARQAYRQVREAMAACDGQQVTVSAVPGLVNSVPVSDDRAEQLAYHLDLDEASYGFQVAQINNTVSWYFQYTAGNQPYDGASAARLMDGLVTQILAVQASLPR